MEQQEREFIIADEINNIAWEATRSCDDYTSPATRKARETRDKRGEKVTALVAAYLAAGIIPPDNGISYKFQSETFWSTETETVDGTQFPVGYYVARQPGSIALVRVCNGTGDVIDRMYHDGNGGLAAMIVSAKLKAGLITPEQAEVTHPAKLDVARAELKAAIMGFAEELGQFHGSNPSPSEDDKFSAALAKFNKIAQTWERRRADEKEIRALLTGA